MKMLLMLKLLLLLMTLMVMRIPTMMKNLVMIMPMLMLMMLMSMLMMLRLMLLIWGRVITSRLTIVTDVFFCRQERKRKEKDLKTLISERQEELERLNGEYESLLRAKAEQELLIAKLSSSSSNNPE
jgi:hypothetical protein